MRKLYKDVKEMIKDISQDASFNNKLSKEIDDKRISKFLFYLRCKHNLTQKQMADKIGCTQSKISKIESAYNKDLSVQDLLDYGKILNLQLEVGFRHPSVKIVDLIKYHVFKIKHLFDQLTELAKDDEDLNIAIAKFHVEAGWNITKIIKTSFSKLDIIKKRLPQSKATVHISAPIESLNIKQTNRPPSRFVKK